MSRFSGLHKILSWLVLLLYLIIIHYDLNFTGDDLEYAQVDYIDANVLADRYYSWSSRLLTETILVALAHFPIIVWKAADICIAMGMLITISYLIIPPKKRIIGNWILVSLFVLYPFSHLGSAGNVATTLNYLWPMAFCLFSLIPMKKMLEGEPVSPFVALCCLIAMILGCDVEQFCMMLVLCYLTIGAFSPQKSFEIMKKYWWIVLPQIAIMTICSAKIAFSPGNARRYILEISTWFPDFERLDIMQKIVLRTANIGAYFLTYEFVTVILAIVLLYIVKRKYDSVFICSVAALPMLIRISVMIYSIVTFQTFSFESLHESMEVRTDIDVMNFYIWRSYLPFVVSFTFLISLFYSIYLAFANTEICKWVLSLYMIGMSTAMAISFSPTMFASGFRTLFAFHMIIIILTLIAVLRGIDVREPVEQKGRVCP